MNIAVLKFDFQAEFYHPIPFVLLPYSYSAEGLQNKKWVLIINGRNSHPVIIKKHLTKTKVQGYYLKKKHTHKTLGCQVKTMFSGCIIEHFTRKTIFKVTSIKIAHLLKFLLSEIILKVTICMSVCTCAHIHSTCKTFKL